MNTATESSTLNPTLQQGSPLDSDIQAQVLGLLTNLYPHGDLAERRSEHRYPFPHLVHLTPIDEDNTVRHDETVVVVGKHLSGRGLGFYHPKPLPYRRMIASLEVGTDAWIAFLIDLSWCRFTKQGWYESGGRFIESVTSPLEGDA